MELTEKAKMKIGIIKTEIKESSIVPIKYNMAEKEWECPDCGYLNDAEYSVCGNCRRCYV